MLDKRAKYLRGGRSWASDRDGRVGLREGLYEEWKKEEETSIVGWNLSHLEGRYSGDSTPWDYAEIARGLVAKSRAVLDMGTGGGELLSSLGPLPSRTAATEIDASFAAVARERLGPLGVDVFEGDHDRGMPFMDGEFDLVLNRHSSLPVQEISRVLSAGGSFLTQQVDPQVEGDFREAFGLPLSPLSNNLSDAKRRLTKAELRILRGEEFVGKSRFKDVGAVVFLLKILGYVIEDFGVDKYLPYLEELQCKVEMGQELIFSFKRFLLLAQKPQSTQTSPANTR